MSNINHPAHYNAGKVECIDALEAATTGLSGIEAFCAANAIKYLWRWKAKNGVEDLEKAKWYIDRMEKGLEAAAGEAAAETAPERAAPYTMEQLEEMRTGAGGLCGVIMVSDLEHPENEDVSAILDWDFKQSEFVAVWGYGVEPYRARDYMTKWAAFPHTKQDVK